jgi:hypothetical protein
VGSYELLVWLIRTSGTVEHRPPAGHLGDAAVAAYRLSVQAGNPLSERKLAQMFGRTSGRWARAKIADVRRAPSSGLTED